MFSFPLPFVTPVFRCDDIKNKRTRKQQQKQKQKQIGHVECSNFVAFAIGFIDCVIATTMIIAMFR